MRVEPLDFAFAIKPDIRDCLCWRNHRRSRIYEWEGISNAIIILSTIIVNAIRYRDSCIKTFDINSVYEIW